MTCSLASEDEADGSITYTKTLSHTCKEISIEGVDLNDEYIVEIVTLNGKMESQSLTLSAKPHAPDSESHCYHCCQCCNGDQHYSVAQ